MNWQTLLKQVQSTYRNAPNPNKPISRTDYLAMLRAFGELVPQVTISDAMDTDFRRNLPGGGISWPEVLPLLERIKDAETFAIENALFPSAGEGIVANLGAIAAMVDESALGDVLAPLKGTFQNILAGNL